MSAASDHRLRAGLVRVNPIPQRHAKRCKASGKVRWITEADVRAVVEESLNGVGSYYHCRSCSSWHVTSGTRAEVVPGVNDGDAADLTLREAIGRAGSVLRTKRRTDARLKYAIAGGELALRWLAHLIDGAPEPQEPLSDARELLDRAQGPWSE